MQKPLLCVAILLFLSSCGGDSATESQPVSQIPIPTPEPVISLDAGQASRLLGHATFGPTMIEIEAVTDIGFEAWVDAQIQRETSSHMQYLQALEPTLNLPEDKQLWHEHRMEAWLHHAITAPDQLRQRVAFALSEIFVVSDKSAFEEDTYGIANYYDLLANHAFSNYRDLLEQVTLSPIMGMYLSVLGNERPDTEKNIRPDENYAREVMQLFSIGLVELNIDGSVKTVDGQSVPTYDQDIIKGFAHVFTGWNFAGVTEKTWYKFNKNYNSLVPMQAIDAFHDKGEKHLLNGLVVPANQVPEQDLTMALDNIFNHPNVGPFIVKQLIQKLVTSNPSTDYIQRIALVFNDNGAGIRGDLAAVIKALLLDDEALNGPINQPNRFGKIREPILAAVHLWRAFAASSPNERYQFGYPAYFFHQAPLSAPSVFNFFSPSYAPLGDIATNNLVAPELEIVTENYLTRTNNFFAYSTLWGHSGVEDIEDERIYINLAQLTPMIEDTQALIDYLNVLLFGGLLQPEEQAIFTDAYQATAEENINYRLSNLLFLMMSSPQYNVQR